jgi:hypothetical protein
MYSLIALVHLEGAAARIAAALAELGAAVAPVMEGSFNGGDQFELGLIILERIKE